MLLPASHPAPRRAESRQWLGGVVRVLELDPGLTDGLDPGDREAARAHAVAPALMVGPGRWTPVGGERCDRLLGLLILDGVATRCVTVEGVLCPELLGRGDVLRPWDEPADGGEGRPGAAWRILTPVTIAVLDRRFVETIRRWPWIASALMSRSIQRARWLALRTALPQVRRADDRLRLLFDHLAARWGRATPSGTVLPLPLTNQLIGELACLRRPTVSSAMGRLAETGQVVRRDGGFLLQ